MAAIYFFGEFAYTNFPKEDYNKEECSIMVKKLLTKNYSSKYKGVSYHKKTKKYQASITIKGKHTYIGLYSTQEEAALAYDEKAREFHKK